MIDNCHICKKNIFEDFKELDCGHIYHGECIKNNKCIKFHIKVPNSRQVNIKTLDYTKRLSEEFIEKYKNKLNWEKICMYQKLSENFINKHRLYVYWKNISMCQKLSEQFIINNSKYVDWTNIAIYQNVSSNLLEKFSHKINYNLLEWMLNTFV